MAQERYLLIVSPDESIRRLARSFKRVGWKVETATNLATAMCRIDANPSAYDFVIMDENPGCQDATFQEVVAGFREIRALNDECKVFILITLMERNKADIAALKGLVDAIIVKKDGFATIFARSARYFRYKVQ